MLPRLPEESNREVAWPVRLVLSLAANDLLSQVAVRGLRHLPVHQEADQRGCHHVVPPGAIGDPVSAMSHVAMNGANPPKIATESA